jgi:hypothetical protein
MFNRSNGERRGSAHFMVGVLAGAAVIGAYAISCDATSPATSSTAGTTGTTGAAGTTGAIPAAGEVPYVNVQSGLGATTVQGAIDEIGTTMRSAMIGGGVVTGGTPGSSTWAMQVKVLDVASEQLTSTGMGTVTLTETAPGQGSYQTSGANIFILDGLTGPPTGTRTGKYFVVGDLVLLTGEISPGHKGGYTWLARLADGGRTLTLSNFGSVVVVLTRQ